MCTASALCMGISGETSPHTERSLHPLVWASAFGPGDRTPANRAAKRARLMVPPTERNLRAGPCRRLLDRSDGEAGDEAVEEQVVEERDRDRRDEARRHQRAPEVDVAAHEERRHAHADH